MGYVVVNDTYKFKNTWTLNGIKIMQYNLTFNTFDSNDLITDIEGNKVKIKAPYKVAFISFGKGATYLSDETYLPNYPKIETYQLVNPYQINPAYPYDGTLKPIDKIEFVSDDPNFDSRRSMLIISNLYADELQTQDPTTITEVGLYAMSMVDDTQLPILIAYTTCYLIRNPNQPFVFKWYLTW